MLRNWMFGVVACALWLVAGAASAEPRYFELTGTVTRSENPRIAQVGSTFRATFNYDDATVGSYPQDAFGIYDLDAAFVATVDGHLLLSDRTLITTYHVNSPASLFDLYSTPGLMIDQRFLPEAFMGFRLIGNGLQGRELPATFDLSQFHYAAGEVMLDGNSTVLLEFSVDAIVNLSSPPPSPCLKHNGKPDRHCKDPLH